MPIVLPASASESQPSPALNSLKSHCRSRSCSQYLQPTFADLAFIARVSYLSGWPPHPAVGDETPGAYPGSSDQLLPSLLRPQHELPARQSAED